MKQVFLKNKRYKNKQIGNEVFGFTLIETLVAITIFALMSTVAVGIFLYILKGARRAKNTQAVKQNGAVVLEKVERAIRDAQVIQQSMESSADCSGSQVYLVNESGVDRVIRCIIADDDSYVEIDGNRLTDVGVEVASCGFECNTADYSQATTVTLNLSLQKGEISEDFELFVTQRKF